LVGALVVAVSVSALAEVARPLRFVNALLGAALIGMPFLLEGGGVASSLFSATAGLLLIALSIPRGKISNAYGELSKYLV
jgi:hypothetical protein